MTLDYYQNLFRGKKILVIGDLMLDRYITGRVERTSPEAPVPILTYESCEDKAGGAANCALNVWSMGGMAAIIGHLGNDVEGETLTNVLSEKGIQLVLSDGEGERVTTLKTRYMSGKVHLMRLDREVVSEMSEYWVQNTIDKSLAFIKDWKPAAVLLQDYNKGVLHPKYILEIISICRSLGIPVVVDPKSQNISSFTGCSILKPNLRELGLMVGRSISPNAQELSVACDELQMQVEHGVTVVTLGEHGVYYKERTRRGILVSPVKIQVADVCGAGDVFASVLALGMGAGAGIAEIVELANELSARCCEKSGVALAVL